MPVAAPAAVGAGMPVLVVGSPLLIVRQRFVGFFGFLELLFRLRIIRITVGMKLHRQLAIGFFYFVAVCVFIDAQHFVIIFFDILNYANA